MTREEAISELKYARAMCEFNPTTGEVCFRNEEDRRQAEALDMAIEALKAQEWIPCNKRLPSEKEWTDSYIRNKKASEFFVMIKGADRPTTLYLSRDYYWFDENRDFYEVVAWMPMPESYKE